MKRLASGFTAFLCDNTAIDGDLQTIALYQALNLARFNVLLDLRRVVMVVTEGFINLGRRQMGQAFEHLFHAESQFIIAYDRLDRRPCTLDKRPATTNPRPSGDVMVPC